MPAKSFPRAEPIPPICPFFPSLPLFVFKMTVKSRSTHTVHFLKKAFAASSSGRKCLKLSETFLLTSAILQILHAFHDGKWKILDVWFAFDAGFWSSKDSLLGAGSRNINVHCSETRVVGARCVLFIRNENFAYYTETHNFLFNMLYRYIRVYPRTSDSSHTSVTLVPPHIQKSGRELSDEELSNALLPCMSLAVALECPQLPHWAWEVG